MYCALQYAVGVSFLVLISNMLSIVFSAPPYNFNAVGLGYMGVGPMTGNILGGLLTGFSSDMAIPFLAKRNKGYFEPEMRLYLLALPVLLQAGGLVLFGISAENVRFL